MAKPKILLYDIETRPNLGYVWEKYEQNVIEYKEEWELLSFAYKWLGEKEVYCLTREGKRTDKDLVKELHKLFQEADILIAHNGDQFDQKKVKARMLFHGMAPPKILTSIDTKKVAKNYFKFNGNGLNDLGQHLKLGKKFKHSGFDMWIGCMKDDKKAWKEMAFYNKQDVILLEKVYERFKPWIQNHPNVAKILNPTGKYHESCPTCGSDSIRREGYRATQSSIKRQLQCKDCDSWFLGKVTVEKKDA